MKKLLGLGAAALAVPAAIASVTLFEPGRGRLPTPAARSSLNVVGEPYGKAMAILKSQGVKGTFGGSFGSDVPQAQCIVSQQKVTRERQDDPRCSTARRRPPTTPTDAAPAAPPAPAAGGHRRRHRRPARARARTAAPSGFPSPSADAQATRDPRSHLNRRRLPIVTSRGGGCNVATTALPDRDRSRPGPDPGPQGALRRRGRPAALDPRPSRGVEHDQPAEHRAARRRTLVRRHLQRGAAAGEGPEAGRGHARLHRPGGHPRRRPRQGAARVHGRPRRRRRSRSSIRSSTSSRRCWRRTRRSPIPSAG